MIKDIEKILKDMPHGFDYREVATETDQPKWYKDVKK